MSKTFQLKNQTIDEDGVVTRQLVIDPITNHAREVWRSDRTNGNVAKAGTYQRYMANDIVVRVTSIMEPERSINLNFLKANDNGELNVVSESFNFYPLVKALTSVINEWLYSEKFKPFLPKGIGWDGELPEIEKIKLERAWNILPKCIPVEYVRELSNALTYTPLSMFTDIDNTMVSVSDRVVDIPNSDLALCVNRDNVCIDTYVDVNRVYVDEDVSRIYLINFIELQDNINRKIELSTIGLV